MPRIACLFAPRLARQALRRSGLAEGSCQPPGEALRAAEAALADLASAFSPLVEPAGDHVWLDVSDLGRLFADEPEIVRALIRGGRHAGLTVRAAIASDKTTAHLVTHATETPTVVATGDEARILAGIPVRALAALGVAPESLALLEQWGVATLGELASLPAGPVARRLGEEGERLSRIARGLATTPLWPAPVPERFCEGLELDWPLADLEAFSFVLRRLVGNLVLRLEARALAASAITLELTLSTSEDGQSGLGLVRTLPLAAPTREIATIVELIRIDLERTPPPAAIERVVLVVTPAPARRVQLDFFRPPEPSPEKLSTALARLAALVGDERIGRAALVDGHLPSAFEMRRYEESSPARSEPRTEIVTPPEGVRLLALRAYRPLRPAEVIEGSRGWPVRVRAEGLGGEVLHTAGPFRVRHGWWTERKEVRDYYDFELSDGGIYRLFHDRVEGRWYVDGCYE